MGKLVVRGFCFLGGLLLILAAMMPGVMVYHAWNEWQVARTGPVGRSGPAGRSYEIETDFGSLTPEQAMAAYGGACLLLLVPGVLACVFAVSGKRWNSETSNGG